MKQLYGYQQKYLAHMPKSIIMAADVGVGKTLMSLHHYMKHGEGRPLLVLAPASKVKTFDWQREIEDFFGLAQPEWYVVSYDKYARDPRPYEHMKNACVIADECHFIAQSQSKRGKAVRTMMMKSDQFIGLSASALPNGWKSMENYAIMFGLVRNKTEFWNTYVRVDRSRGFPIILGYNQEDRLQRFWNSISKPLPREGNVDLPPQVSIGKRIEINIKQMKEYKHILRHRVYEHEELDNPSKLFNALRQSLTEVRRDTLISLIEESDQHIVVFYNYNRERDMILDVMKKHFPDRDVYEQSGHVSNLPQRKEWETMKPSVTLAQYQSASTAIELTYASITIFLSPTYSYANFHQAKGRTSRIGQKKTTVYYMLSVDSTVDHDVWQALKHKQDFDARLWHGYNEEDRE